MVKYRRIKFDRIKDWLIKAGVTGVPVIIALFLFLQSLDAIEVTGYSGDMVCEGTIEDPCYAYINFTAKTNIYIYPMNETEQMWVFNTNPIAKEIILQRSWGDGWRTINLSKPWSNRVKYAIKFNAGQSYQLRFIGYKYDPGIPVKWSFGEIDPVWKPNEIINYELNTKTVSGHGINLMLPLNSKCSWIPNSDYKACEIIGEIENTNGNSIPLDFIERISLSFDYPVQDKKIYWSNKYNNATEQIFNVSCYENCELNYKDNCTNICYYNKTYKDWYDWNDNWLSVSNLPANSLFGIKLEFKSPILIENKTYINNHFNLILNGVNKQLTLDPDISACTNINSPGTYVLTGNIIDSSTSKCIDIDANNVVLDCQGNTIDGDTAADYGIWIDRVSEEDVNVTIKNCVLTDWDYATINLDDCHNVTINNTNITGNNGDSGIYMWDADDFYFENLIIGGTPQYGIYERSSSNYGTIINSVSSGATNWDFMASGMNSGDFAHTFINFNGTGNKPIVIIKDSISNWNNNFSELILANIGDIILDNITFDMGTDTNGIIARGNKVNITNSRFTDLYAGVYCISAGPINIKDSNYTGCNKMLYYESSCDDGVIDNIILDGQGGDGIRWDYHSDTNTLKNSLIKNLSEALYLDGDGSNLIFNNIFEDINEDIIYITSKSENNKIYNNLFNTSAHPSYDPIDLGSGTFTNYLNTTNQSGGRIFGSGTNIGGNVYINGSGTGYYYDCTDSDTDGFCDNPWNESEGSAIAIDWLPYSDEYIMFSCGLNSGITFNFPCDIDSGTTYGEPQGQNATLGAIWCKNLGASAIDFGVTINDTPAEGWNFFFNSTNVTAITEITTGSYITWWDEVPAGENKSIWLYNNCSAGTTSQHGIQFLFNYTED